MKFLIWLSTECTCLKELIDSVRSHANEVAVLLIQDGVFLADKGCPYSSEIEQLNIEVYASKSHVDERGILDRMVDNVSFVEYPKIIQLIMEEYDRIISL